MERQMASKIKVAVIPLLIILFLCSVGYAQKAVTVEELEKRIDFLEKERDFWKEHHAEQKEVIKGYLDNRLIQVERDLKNDNNYIKALSWTFGSVTVIGIIIAISSLLMSYFKLKKKLEEIAEEKIRGKFDLLFETKLSQLLDDKRSRIHKIIHDIDEQVKLRNEKSILVISKDEADDVFLKMFFEEMGFNSQNVKFMRLDEAKDVNKYDLILFNNESDKKDKDADHSLEFEIMSKTRKDAVGFYFGPNRFESDEYKNKINFANSRLQLYGNLINTLRYQPLFTLLK